LVDVHPDYIGFGETRARGSEYPAAWYQEFLEHAAKQYAGTFWNALPRELADWYATVRKNSTKPSSGSAGKRIAGVGRHLDAAAPKRICMIAHSIYESDNRVIRYANA